MLQFIWRARQSLSDDTQDTKIAHLKQVIELSSPLLSQNFQIKDIHKFDCMTKHKNKKKDREANSNEETFARIFI